CLLVARSDHEIENVLLLGASDIRHVLMTVAGRVGAKLKSGPTDSTLHVRVSCMFSRGAWIVSFTLQSFCVRQLYMQDESLEAAARHMLLMTVLMDQSLSRQVRMEMFCEIFGNVLVRVKTYEYLIDKAKALITFVESANDDAASDATPGSGGSGAIDYNALF